MVEGTVDMARRLMEETALRQAVLEKATNMVLEGSLGRSERESCAINQRRRRPFSNIVRWWLKAVEV
jgi:hypothetical protein